MNNSIMSYLEKKNWKVDNQKKEAFKVFTFDNFKDAFSWMTEILASKFEFPPPSAIHP